MQIDYRIIHSKRKKLSITVERDKSVIVHAPEGTSQERIRDVIKSRKQWIYEKMHHPQKYQGRIHPPGKELVSGESILYLGRNYRIELVDEEGDIIFLNSKFLVPKTLKINKYKVFKNWYINKAEEKILPRVPHYAESLGVIFNQVKISDSKYRWGSCTPKDNVNLNWRLIKAPMFVIDYVIVHELTHFLEPNHTPEFWNIVRSQIPNHEKAKKWLMENGELLEHSL